MKSQAAKFKEQHQLTARWTAFFRSLAGFSWAMASLSEFFTNSEEGACDLSNLFAVMINGWAWTIAVPFYMGELARIGRQKIWMDSDAVIDDALLLLLQGLGDSGNGLQDIKCLHDQELINDDGVTAMLCLSGMLGSNGGKVWPVKGCSSKEDIQNVFTKTTFKWGEAGSDATAEKKPANKKSHLLAEDDSNLTPERRKLYLQTIRGQLGIRY